MVDFPCLLNMYHQESVCNLSYVLLIIQFLEHYIANMGRMGKYMYVASAQLACYTTALYASSYVYTIYVALTKALHVLYLYMRLRACPKQL